MKTMICTIACATMLLNVAPASAQVLSLDEVRGKSENEKTLTLSRMYAVHVPKVIEEKEVDGDKQVVHKRTYMVPEYRQMLVTMSLLQARAFDAAGNKLTEAAMWQRLKEGEVILTASVMPDPAYRKALAKDTLIIVMVPPPLGPYKSAPPPIPPR